MRIFMSRGGGEISGSFARVAPVAFAEKADFPLGWVVVSHRWLTAKADRRDAHGRWYRIQCDGRTIYRAIRFSGKLKGSPKQGIGEIVIDWPGWLDLNGRAEEVDNSIELSLRRVRFYDLPRVPVHHPDPAIRVAGWLGLISVGLGILSIILALV